MYTIRTLKNNNQELIFASRLPHSLKYFFIFSSNFCLTEYKGFSCCIELSLYKEMYGVKRIIILDSFEQKTLMKVTIF